MNTKMRIAEAMLPSDDPTWIEFARKASVQLLQESRIRTVDTKHENGRVVLTVVMDA